MARTRLNAADGLELLLDTICNTFGGVLFIAILVVILLNVTSEEVAQEPATKDQQTRLRQLQAELDASEGELARLEQAAALRNAIEGEIGSAEIKNLLRQIAQLETRIAHTTKKKNRNLQELANLTQDANRRAEAAKDFQKELRQLKAQQIKVESQLEAEKSKKVTSLGLPKQRLSTKVQAGFMLQGGRLRTCTKSSGEIDLSECLIEEDGGVQYVVPRPATGVALDPTGQDRHPILQRLAPFDAANRYVFVVVYEDSFAHFETMRAVLEEEGYEYNVLLLQAEEKAPLHSGSSPIPVPVQGS